MADFVDRFVDHYQVLRLELSATDFEIKQAYMKLSRSFHPDKYGAPEATATFQMIGNSYEILKDKKKRKAYDAERIQVMGTQMWAYPPLPPAADNELSVTAEESASATNSDTEKVPPEDDKLTLRGADGRLTFNKGMKPIGKGRPRRRWKPKPELQNGLYTIYEEDETIIDYTEPKSSTQDVARVPAARLLTMGSEHMKLFNPISFIPSRSSWFPRSHTPAEMFRHWKSAELRSRDRRVRKWSGWAEELLGQIEIHRRNAQRQVLDIARVSEDLQTSIEIFRSQMAAHGIYFGSEEELNLHLSREKWFKHLILDKLEADKALVDIKKSIRIFMDELQDHQDDFEQAEHKALLSVACKVVVILDKKEYIEDKYPKDVEKSKIEWHKLKHIGVTAFQKYRQPAEIQRACLVSWGHDMKVEEEDYSDVRICRRCNRDIFFNCFTCTNCASFMCSTCNDRVTQLRRYHAWLGDDHDSDKLFGV